MDSRGYKVVRVVKGDYRQPAAPATAARAWRVDPEALKAACDLLGLRLPVKVRFNARQGATAGNYRHKGTYHDIMLKSYRTAEQASETLWHELTHAMQAERAGDQWAWNSVANDQRRYPYSRRPIEIEAREIAGAYADILLTRPC